MVNCNQCTVGKWLLWFFPQGLLIDVGEPELWVAAEPLYSQYPNQQIGVSTTSHGETIYNSLLVLVFITVATSQKKVESDVIGEGILIAQFYYP